MSGPSCLAFCALLASIAHGSFAADGIHLESTPIPLHLVDPTLDRVGQLRYLGGLSLRAEDERFGGLSGLLVSADGRSLVAVSDMGDWFEIQVSYDEEGRLAGASGVASGRLRDTMEAPVGDKRDADAESIARLADGSILVGFEMGHRLWRYSGASPLLKAAEPYQAPERLNEAPQNLGVEALVALEDGRVLVLTEGVSAGPGLLRGWIGAPGDWAPLAYRRRGRPRPTDATRLPNGDVVVLERGFTESEGPEIRLRRLAAAEIEAGALLDGEVIAEMRPLLNVDNFEGLDNRVDEKGNVLLYLLSDDNFSERQRTLLLLFALEEPTEAP